MSGYPGALDVKWKETLGDGTTTCSQCGKSISEGEPQSTRTGYPQDPTYFHESCPLPKR